MKNFNNKKSLNKQLEEKVKSLDSACEKMKNHHKIKLEVSIIKSENFLKRDKTSSTTNNASEEKILDFLSKENKNHPDFKRNMFFDSEDSSEESKNSSDNLKGFNFESQKKTKNKKFSKKMLVLSEINEKFPDFSTDYKRNLITKNKENINQEKTSSFLFEEEKNKNFQKKLKIMRNNLEKEEKIKKKTENNFKKDEEKNERRSNEFLIENNINNESSDKEIEKNTKKRKKKKRRIRIKRRKKRKKRNRKKKKKRMKRILFLKKDFRLIRLYIFKIN